LNFFSSFGTSSKEGRVSISLAVAPGHVDGEHVAEECLADVRICRRGRRSGVRSICSRTLHGMISRLPGLDVEFRTYVH
jgi:hypothetical protein